MPGLEGGKVRLLSAAVLLVLFAINSLGTTVYTPSAVVGTVTGVCVSLILLLQGASEVLSDSGISGVRAESSSATYLTALQNNIDEEKGKIVAMAADAVARCIDGVSFVSLISIESDIEDSKVLFELGPISKPPIKLSIPSPNFRKTLSEQIVSMSVADFQESFSENNLLNAPITCKEIIIVPAGGNNKVWLIGLTRVRDRGESTLRENKFIKNLLNVPTGLN